MRHLPPGLEVGPSLFHVGALLIGEPEGFDRLRIFEQVKPIGRFIFGQFFDSFVRSCFAVMVQLYRNGVDVMRRVPA